MLSIVCAVLSIALIHHRMCAGRLRRARTLGLCERRRVSTPMRCSSSPSGWYTFDVARGARHDICRGTRQDLKPKSMLGLAALLHATVLRLNFMLMLHRAQACSAADPSEETGSRSMAVAPVFPPFGRCIIAPAETVEGPHA